MDNDLSINDFVGRMRDFADKVKFIKQRLVGKCSRQEAIFEDFGIINHGDTVGFFYQIKHLTNRRFLKRIATNGGIGGISIWQRRRYAAN